MIRSEGKGLVDWVGKIWYIRSCQLMFCLSKALAQGMMKSVAELSRGRIARLFNHDCIFVADWIVQE